MKSLLKKGILLLGVLFMSFNVSAQEINKEDVQYLQSLIGAEKKEVMKQLVPNATDKYWEVYSKYEVERQKVGLKRIELIKKYKDFIDNQKVKDQVVLDATKLFKKNDVLISKYFKKLKRVSDSKHAVTFVKVERYILSLISQEIMGDLILLEL